MKGAVYVLGVSVGVGVGVSLDVWVSWSLGIVSCLFYIL